MHIHWFIVYFLWYLPSGRVISKTYADITANTKWKNKKNNFRISKTSKLIVQFFWRTKIVIVLYSSGNGVPVARFTTQWVATNRTVKDFPNNAAAMKICLKPWVCSEGPGKPGGYIGMKEELYRAGYFGILGQFVNVSGGIEFRLCQEGQV